jgi:hypothetical protein
MRYISIILLLLLSFSLSFANQDVSDKLIYSSVSIMQESPSFMINDEGEFFIGLDGSTFNSIHLYKYEEQKLTNIGLSFDDKQLLNNYYYEYKINDKKYVSLKVDYFDNYFKLVLNNAGSKIGIAKDYVAVGDMYNLFYMDTIHEQFYFSAISEFDRKTSKGREEALCLYLYDIKTNSMILLRKELNKDFFQVIRIPNTQFLLYFSYPNVRISFNDIVEKKISEIVEIWIREIPEWKAEIEQQRKNEKLYPNAKKYFINGPANIRDNPKGKSIVYLNDWTKVLVLNQQGDWYEILYANIKGWTYKDNLRIGIKNEQ